MKIAFVGSRDFPNEHLITEVMFGLPVDTVVVSGGAPGVDTWAKEAAETFGLRTKIFPADWEKHGKAAGPIRNAEIVAFSDRVVAFWDGKSRGTLDTIKKARAAGKPVVIFRPDGSREIQE